MYFPKYKIEVTYLEDQNDSGYKVNIPSFNATIFVDDTKDIPGLVEETIKTLIKEYKKNGLPIPKSDTDEDAYSGRLSLRIPRRLHQNLSYNAKREKVSLNQYLLYLLSQAAV